MLNAMNEEEEHRYLPRGWVAVLSLVSIIGILGNILIIGAVCISQRLRVKGHAFTVNLAVADLVVSCYIMPVGLVTSQFSHNPFGPGMCGFNAFLIMTSCGVSTQSLMLIAIERYFLICQTPYHKVLFSKPLIGIYLALTWFYTAVWTCQGWTGWTMYLYGVDIWVCMFDGTYSISYDVCLVLFGMLIPMTILCFCYTKIFMLVRKNRKALKQHRARPNNKNEQVNLTGDSKHTKKEVRLTVTLVVIVLVFCVCWTPASIVIVLAGVWPGMPSLLYTVAVWFAFTNSSMNSLLYGLLNKNFRDGYKRVLFSVLCCKKEECSTKYQCTCLSSEETSSSSKPHSNDTAKTDTLSKRKNMIIRPITTAVRVLGRPNSVTDIVIDPVQLWSPEEVDRSCKYVPESSTEEQNNSAGSPDIPNTINPPGETDTKENPTIHPLTPGSVELSERPSSCRSRVTTLLPTNETSL